MECTSYKQIDEQRIKHEGQRKFIIGFRKEIGRTRQTNHRAGLPVGRQGFMQIKVDKRQDARQKDRRVNSMQRKEARQER
ncbi:MAG: hypothetical protein ACUZ8I_03595 [Candidatus Scalindua sp.]